jgi:hypothetical protein
MSGSAVSTSPIDVPPLHEVDHRGSGPQPVGRCVLISADSRGHIMSIPDDGFEPIEPDDEPFEPIDPDPDLGEPRDKAGKDGYGATPDMTEEAGDG